MDMKLVEYAGSSNAVQIKRERFEEHMQNQQGPPQDYYQQPPPQFNPGPDQAMLQQPQHTFPSKLFNVTGRAIQHLDKDMMLFESPDKTWRCLVFREHFIPTTYLNQPPPSYVDLKVQFPLNSMAMLNADLIGPDKPIQFVATKVFKPVADPSQMPNPGMPERPLNDYHMMKYDSVCSTVGKVFDTVSKLGINPGAVSSSQIAQCEGSYIAHPGTVHQILDENFGLVKIQQGLVLFDTCDLWIAPNMSASKSGKALGQVLKLGEQVVIHACRVDNKFKVAHLATAVWSRGNPGFANPQFFPPHVTLDNIHGEKIDIYRKVVSSIDASIEGVSGINDIINVKHVITWQRASVKAVFFDKVYQSNGNLVAGIVSVATGVPGYAFFMSKNFAQLASVPNVGMEQYVNLYPTREMPENHKYGGINYICTNLYSVFMKGSCTIPNAAKLKEIVEESSDMLSSLMIQYPKLYDPLDFIR